MRFRDQFFAALRGRAWVEAPSMKVDLEVGLQDPQFARAEISGALGMKVGLFLINEKWVQIYIPREKSVFRFPTAEMEKDTARRARFAKMVPLSVDPQLAVRALLTRVDPPAKLAPDACRFDAEKNAYEFRWKDADGYRLTRLDPTTYAPLEIFYFRSERGIPAAGSEDRADWHVLYSEFTGEGTATLPSRIEFIAPAKGRELVWEWVSVEAWQDVPRAAFEWQAPAGVTVQDY